MERCAWFGAYSDGFFFTSVAVASNLVLLATLLLLPDPALEEHLALRLLVSALILPAYLPRLPLLVVSVQAFGPGPAPSWFGALVPVLAIAPFLLLDLIRAMLVLQAERRWEAVQSQLGRA